MKRIIAIALMALVLSGCAKGESAEATQEEPEDVSRFAVVEKTYPWKVVYDRETGVMYTISYGGYNMGTFTLLVDAEGNPLIYEGVEK